MEIEGRVKSCSVTSELFSDNTGDRIFQGRKPVSISAVQPAIPDYCHKQTLFIAENVAGGDFRIMAGVSKEA